MRQGTADISKREPALAPELGGKEHARVSTRPAPGHPVAEQSRRTPRDGGTGQCSDMPPSPKVTAFEITLTNPTGIYHPGDIVSGSLIVNLREDVKMNGR